MELTNEKYAKMVDLHTPKSHIIKDSAGAFLTGGFICCIGQFISDLYKLIGFSQKDSACLVSMTLVFMGAALTYLGLYDNLAKFAGAGTLVPITGFANAVASPAMEFRSEGLVPGTGAKMFAIAGPVIAYGAIASVIYGVVLYLFP